MANVMRLPTELLLSILTSCSAVEDAAHLSRVNRRMHLVWLENTNHIVEMILPATWPAYDLALSLALAEQNTANPTRSRDWEELLPLLRHNATLASRAKASWLKHVAEMPARHYRHKMSTASFPIPYYLVRRLVHSYHRPEMRSNILAALGPPDILKLSCELCGLLAYYEDEESRVAHGIGKDRDLWTWEEERYGEANKDEWEWAYQTLQDMLDDRGLRTEPADVYT